MYGINTKLVQIATALWGIWYARNKSIWENKYIPSSVVMQSSKKQIDEWHEVQKRRIQNSTGLRKETMQHEKKWRPPAEGSMKINIDASVFEGHNYFSVGMVLRNYRGHCISSKTMRFSGQVTVPEAEMIGIMEALQWAQELPAHKIIVEIDSMQGVNSINKPESNYLELGDIIRQCRIILQSTVSILVVFVRKHANKVARSLARLPCELNSFVLYSSPPLVLLETILSDISLI